jgi:Icc protein
MQFKFIHLTDPHFVAGGQTLYGLDPRGRLRAAIASINAAHTDAAFCIVTGDLAHWGQPEAYADLGRQLTELRIPCHLLIGNHDHRESFVRAFPQVPTDDRGFVQRVIETPHGPFLCLDTNEPNVSWGVLCERRLDWLETRLAARPREPATLFLHHPPFPVGIRAMDRIALRETGRFERILAAHRGGIRHLFFGHLHRPVSGSWRGIPFSTLRATNHQVWLDLETDGRVPGSHEPPQYAVVLIDDRLTVVHLHDFLDDTHGFFL